MKSSTKRITLLLLSLVMVFALVVPFSVVAFAEDEVLEITNEESAMSYDDAQEYVGSYEDNLTEEGFAETLSAAIAAIQEEVSGYATFLSLIPPILAILLALITKEVYVSLFAGIFSGALIYTGFNLWDSVIHTFTAIISSIADSWNAGILIFLVILGIMVCLMNQAGGSAAYAKWAKMKIKTKTGALLSTFALGVLIFIDDYFNCLTVGSVMRPVTDSHGISRAKLAYIIDATAAPICIIAPISSWAAAVAGVAPDGEGLTLFVQSIPYNLYAILTIFMVISISLMKFDFGPMKKHETAAMEGDLHYGSDEKFEEMNEAVSSKGKVLDLVLPVAVLIASCVAGMVYTGGFFDGESFIDAFANADASFGLVIGSFIALVFTAILYLPRKVLSFKEFTGTFTKGFNAMVPPILILVFAWTLGAITKTDLGARVYVAEFVRNSAESLQYFLPAIIFVIAAGLSFATGTSWGTFGILLPIVVAIFPTTEAISVISISACLAGAVCGDHCSPISDTTIMASAGAQCNHINHVKTQIPYVAVVAAISFVGYILAGFVQNAYITLAVCTVVLVGVLFAIKAITSKGDAKAAPAKKSKN
ncbi:MAG: Na+/H+ antiporter NhaC family protein [Clostridia bacterium]